MYGTEAYIAWFLIFICSYATARVLVSCFVEPFICWIKGSYNNWKEKKTHQITIEEIQDFLAQVDFENMVREYAEGLHDNDPIPETDPYIEFEIPCAGYDCALSPREKMHADLNIGRNGGGKVYCKIKFNLSKLVEEGKEEFAYPTSDPNLVTPEEAKMFHDWYLKFTKYLESKENTQEV